MNDHPTYEELQQRVKELVAKNNRLAESQRIAHIGSWEHNLTTNEVFWSDELFRLLSLDPEKDGGNFDLFFSMVHPDDQPLLKKSIEESLHTHKPFNIEYRFNRRDGKTRILRAQAELIPDSNGELVILSGTSQDITKRKRTEEALRESEKNLSRAQTIAHVGDWEWDIITNKVRWSDELYRIYGFEPHTIDPDYGLVLDQMHPASKDEFMQAIDAALKEDKPFEMDYWFFQKDGSEAILHTIGHVVRNESGEPVKMFGIVQDITERKNIEAELEQHRANLEALISERTEELQHTIKKLNNEITERKLVEEALQESEQRYRNIYDTAPLAFVLWDRETRITGWNNQAEKMFGWTREEITGRNIFDYIIPESARIHVQDIVKLLLEGRLPSSSINENITKSGRTIVCEWNNSVIRDSGGNVAGVISLGLDITERQRAEEALRDSEERFRAITTTASDAILLMDDRGRIVYWNLAAERIFGYTTDEVVGQNLHLLLAPPRLHDEYLKGFARFVTTGQGPVINRSRELAALKKDGTEFPMEVSTSAININGKWHALGIVRDISERKLAEEALRRSEAFNRNILDAVDEGFIVVDRDFRILTVNNAFCRQVGESSESIIGRRCYEVSHRTFQPCDEEGEKCPVRHVFETGESCTVIHKHPVGKKSTQYFEMKAFPIKDSTGAVISVIETITNITEKQLLEEEQLKAAKLESIGILAGGLAHDFNNLLQGIFGYISIAKMTIDQREKALAMLNQAEKALHLSINLTGQLLTFSKGGKPLKMLIKLKPVIENSVKFALSGSPTNHQLNISADLWPVEADAGQMAQVIQNIMINAVQAMPVGGTIVITAKNVLPSDDGLPQHMKEGKYVKITIQDTGIGIPEDYIQKIFDPYFTTKEKGSGLGLATSFSIIRNHDGIIDVASEPGKGTTFSIYLPAVEAENEIRKAPAVSSVGRQGKILVMDDEEMVQNVARELLIFLGHEVDLAKNGEAAIAKYRAARESGAPFDIVILDLTIPGGLGGIETIKRLLAIDPGVKAIVSSGYSDDAAMSDYHTYGFKACLTKPYTLANLSDALNALLDK